MNSPKICEYDEGHRGPLLILMAGIHGNEGAGVQALKTLNVMLQYEHVKNPTFRFKGKIIGLLANPEAYKAGKRYIDRDMNRLFLPEYIHAEITDETPYEVGQVQRFLKTIDDEIKDYGAEEVYFLDLHTTSAHGGIFTIVAACKHARAIASKIPSPVILDFEKHLAGTTLSYLEEKYAHLKRACLVFESGQHDNALSINRAIAYCVHLLRAVDMIRARDVNSHHTEILNNSVENLPLVTRLTYTYHIEPNEEFMMMEGFRNFDEVHRGQLLAVSNGKEVACETDGYILMPKYQKQGDDGYFLIEEIAI